MLRQAATLKARSPTPSTQPRTSNLPSLGLQGRDAKCPPNDVSSSGLGSFLPCCALLLLLGVAVFAGARAWIARSDETAARTEAGGGASRKVDRNA